MSIVCTLTHFIDLDEEVRYTASDLPDHDDPSPPPPVICKHNTRPNLTPPESKAKANTASKRNGP